jgi:hypothetical protein
LPTPISHLAIANEILELKAVLELEAVPGWFLFGSIAPDVSAVSDLSRADTHFFYLHLPNLKPSPQVMLERYPNLAKPSEMRPFEAIFLAGYLSHILIDEMWIKSIFRPYFSFNLRFIQKGNLQSQRASDKRRKLLHNVLRTYIDREDFRSLGEDTLRSLRACNAKGLLPFVRDEDLQAWLDLVCEQLTPGADVKTIDIFAERMGVPSSEVEAVLSSPKVLQEEIFDRLPLSKLEEFRREAVKRSLDLIKNYLFKRYKR